MLYFFPGLFFIFFSHSCSFRGVGVLNWVLGLGLPVDGVLGLWNEAIWGFWGYMNIKNNPGKKNFACWTPSFCDSLNFRISQRNELWRGKHQFPCIIHIHPHRLWIYHANFFWKSTNKNANLFLDTAMGVSYWVNLIVKPRTYSFGWIKPKIDSIGWQIINEKDDYFYHEWLIKFQH